MPSRRSGLYARLFLVATLAGAIAPAHASPASEAASKVWSGAQDVAMYALGLIGVNYKFGGESPDTGLDCSGLVRHVFQEVTGVALPRTAKEMSALGTKVSAGDLKPGDLVFFNTRRFAFSHVGLYLGDNRFVHAIDQSYWQKHFNGARRVIGVLPSLVPQVISPALASEFAAQPFVAAPSPLAFERADLTP